MIDIPVLSQSTSTVGINVGSYFFIRLCPTCWTCLRKMKRKWSELRSITLTPCGERQVGILTVSWYYLYKTTSINSETSSECLISSCAYVSCTHTEGFILRFTLYKMNFSKDPQHYHTMCSRGGTADVNSCLCESASCCIRD